MVDRGDSAFCWLGEQQNPAYCLIDAMVAKAAQKLAAFARAKSVEVTGSAPARSRQRGNSHAERDRPALAARAEGFCRKPVLCNTGTLPDAFGHVNAKPIISKIFSAEATSGAGGVLCQGVNRHFAELI
jgi:hypothetical protein